MILMKKDSFCQRGQIVLVALLIGLVVLTIGLGVANRSITDIKLSRQEEESTRAFNVAEAGIEEFLKEADLSVHVKRHVNPDVDGTGIRRVIDVAGEGELEVALKPNETAEIDLSGIDYEDSLRIYWIDTEKGEDPGSCSEGEGQASASIEVMIYHKEGDIYSVRRSGFNSCSGLYNEFEEADAGSDPFKSATDIFVNNDDKLVRVRVLYNEATIHIVGRSSLGVQMYKITSRAQASVGETRQIEVERTKPALPAIFDYVLFSGGSLVK